MTAEQAIDHLYEVAEGNYEVSLLDVLTERAGFRTPYEGDGVRGEMRPLNHNSIETIIETRDAYVPHSER